MSYEEDTKRLLTIREDLNKRMKRLQLEIKDLSKAIEGIDNIIVRQGFRKPVGEKPSVEDVGEGEASIKAKDGAILGTIDFDEKEIVFKPREDLVFNTSTPPFQAFLIDRVLANMRSIDEKRASEGEISPEEVLSFEVSSEQDRITSLTVYNYGGERRFSEIRSSLRWTFDKMYENLEIA